MQIIIKIRLCIRISNMIFDKHATLLLVLYSALFPEKFHYNYIIIYLTTFHSNIFYLNGTYV